MSIGALDATAAYGRSLGIGKDFGGLGGTAKSDAPSGGGFGDMIQTMVSGAASAMHGAEAASIKQIAGKGDLIDVVTAIGAAETALDTVVAVRDRVVSAYSDIMRMQI